MTQRKRSGLARRLIIGTIFSCTILFTSLFVSAGIGTDLASNWLVQQFLNFVKWLAEISQTESRNMYHMIIPLITARAIIVPEVDQGEILDMVGLTMSMMMPIVMFLIIYTAIKLILASASPSDRFKAKQNLQKMLTALILMPLSPALSKIMLNINYSLTRAILVGPDSAFYQIMCPAGNCQSWAQTLANASQGWVGLGGGIIMLCVGIITTIAFGLIFFRFIMVILCTILMPLTIALYMFEFTKSIGRQFLKYTIGWIFTPLVMAAWICVSAAIMVSLGSMDTFTGIWLFMGTTVMIIASPLMITGVLAALGNITTSVGQMIPTVLGLPFVVAGEVMQGQEAEAVVAAGVKQAANLMGGVDMREHAAKFGMATGEGGMGETGFKMKGKGGDTGGSIVEAASNTGATAVTTGTTAIGTAIGVLGTATTAGLAAAGVVTYGISEGGALVSAGTTGTTVTAIEATGTTISQSLLQGAKGIIQGITQVAGKATGAAIKGGVKGAVKGTAKAGAKTAGKAPRAFRMGRILGKAIGRGFKKNGFSGALRGMNKARKSLKLGRGLGKFAKSGAKAAGKGGSKAAKEAAKEGAKEGTKKAGKSLFERVMPKTWARAAQAAAEARQGGSGFGRSMAAGMAEGAAAGAFGGGVVGGSIKAGMEAGAKGGIGAGLRTGFSSFGRGIGQKAMNMGSAIKNLPKNIANRFARKQGRRFGNTRFFGNMVAAGWKKGGFRGAFKGAVRAGRTLGAGKKLKEAAKKAPKKAASELYKNTKEAAGKTVETVKESAKDDQNKGAEEENEKAPGKKDNVMKQPLKEAGAKLKEKGKAKISGAFGGGDSSKGKDAAKSKTPKTAGSPDGKGRSGDSSEGGKGPAKAKRGFGAMVWDGISQGMGFAGQSLKRGMLTAAIGLGTGVGIGLLTGSWGAGFMGGALATKMSGAHGQGFRQNAGKSLATMGGGSVLAGGLATAGIIGLGMAVGGPMTGLLVGGAVLGAMNSKSHGATKDAFKQGMGLGFKDAMKIGALVSAASILGTVGGAGSIAYGLGGLYVAGKVMQHTGLGQSLKNVGSESSGGKAFVAGFRRTGIVDGAKEWGKAGGMWSRGGTAFVAGKMAGIGTDIGWKGATFAMHQAPKLVGESIMTGGANIPFRAGRFAFRAGRNVARATTRAAIGNKRLGDIPGYNRLQKNWFTRGMFKASANLKVNEVVNKPEGIWAVRRAAVRGHRAYKYGKKKAGGSDGSGEKGRSGDSGGRRDGGGGGSRDRTADASTTTDTTKFDGTKDAKPEDTGSGTIDTTQVKPEDMPKTPQPETQAPIDPTKPVTADTSDPSTQTLKPEDLGSGTVDTTQTGGQDLKPEDLGSGTTDTTQIKPEDAAIPAQPEAETQKPQQTPEGTESKPEAQTDPLGTFSTDTTQHSGGSSDTPTPEGSGADRSGTVLSSEDEGEKGRTGKAETMREAASGESAQLSPQEQQEQTQHINRVKQELIYHGTRKKRKQSVGDMLEDMLELKDDQQGGGGGGGGGGGQQ